MRRILLPLGIALLLASCGGEPRYTYPPPSDAPLAPPQPAAKPKPQVSAAPLPDPHSVKPLGKGVLTAKNVGNYMDDEERELRIGLKSSGVGVGRPGDAITLFLRTDVLFEPNSLTFSRTGARILKLIAIAAVRYDSTAITVNGYTDTTGTPESDVKLSQDRANAVSQSLTAAGVSARRIETHGFGATHLKIPTGPNFSEPRNRRIEVLITPKMTA